MDIEKLLKDKGLSVTENRKLIIECLTDSNEHFHSISDISKHIGNINTKSIYNNIKQLIAAGLVDSYSFGGIPKYALNENIAEGLHEIHIVDNNNEINHLEVNPKIFHEIEKEINKSGKKATSIKIFVKVE